MNREPENEPNHLVNVVLNRHELQLLLRALDTYAGVVQLRAQEARSTGGMMRTQLNEGIPARGLSADRLSALGVDAEQLTDRLLGLIPDHVPITPVFEDGTPVCGDEICGFPVPASSALYLKRQHETTCHPWVPAPGAISR